jgi:hypothetical protein
MAISSFSLRSSNDLYLGRSNLLKLKIVLKSRKSGGVRGKKKKKKKTGEMGMVKEKETI